MSRTNLLWMSYGSAEELNVDSSFQHFRFHLEPKGALRMPPYNKGNMIRGGLGNGFEL